MVNIDGSLLPILGYFSFMALSMLSLAFSVKIFFIFDQILESCHTHRL